MTAKRDRVVGSVLIVLGVLGLCLAQMDTAHAADRAGSTTSQTRALKAAPAARRTTNPTVVLYGDSLAWEAKEFFAFNFANRSDVHVVARTYGGTAICDWLAEMADDAVALVPSVVVIEFSGNALTTCMQDSAGRALTGEALVERYRADVEAAIAAFAAVGAQILLAGAPVIQSAERHPDGVHDRTLNGMYADVADRYLSVRYVDAGASVLDQGGWTATLPCLPGEPCTGGLDGSGQPVNVVRAPDGIHFCPAAPNARRGVTQACPVWSSGAFRFAAAMARAAIEGLPTRRAG